MQVRQKLLEFLQTDAKPDDISSNKHSVDIREGSIKSLDQDGMKTSIFSPPDIDPDTWEE